MEGFIICRRGSQNISEATPEGYDSDKCNHLPGQPEPSITPSPLNRTTLEDLPNELLQQILGHLLDKDLYQAALISQRFNRLAIPMYLWRYGAGGPTSRLLLFNYLTKDIIRALFTAVFRPTLHTVQYVIDCWKTAELLNEEIELVTRVLQKVSGQTTMILDFANTGPPPGKTLYAPIPTPVDMPMVYGFPPGIQDSTLRNFFDAIVATGCKTFVIQHCVQQKAAQSFLALWIEEQFSGLPGLRRKLASLCPPFISGRRVPKNSAVEIFNLNSPMAFHPQVINWTLNTLNFSRITTLSIVYHQAIDAQAWVYILPHVSVQALTTLIIDFVKIPAESLVTFLYRHSNITTLHLGLYVPIPADIMSFPTRALPKLTHLTAPREWCNVFLCPIGALPSLVSATASVRVPCFRRLDLSYPVLSYEPAMARLLTVKEVHLSLSFAFGSFEWLLDTPSKHDCNDSDENRNDNPNPLTTSVTDSHIGEIRLVVTHLHLHTPRYHLPMALSRGLYLWLVRFPVLKHLRIYTLNSPAGIAASYEGQFLRESVMTLTNVSTVHFEIFQKT